MSKVIGPQWDLLLGSGEGTAHYQANTRQRATSSPLSKMVLDTHYYDLLGLDSTASESDIKRAYRKKAMEHHPDKNPNDHKAAERFQEMAEAYETLIDPDSREAYDQFGLDGDPPGMGGMNPDDLFAQMFGGMRFDMGGSGGPPRGPGRNGKRKGEDSTIDYKVTLEDLYNGKSPHFNLEKGVICTTCKGQVRWEGEHKAQEVHGLGRGQVGMSQVVCPECAGEGLKFKDKDRCKKCKGDKTTKEKKQVDIFIEKGMVDKQKIILRGEGDQEPGVETGDLIFVLRLEPHTAFERSGPDLLTTVHITLSEALLGFDRILITHLDGRGIRVTSEKNKIIRSNDTIVIRGEGMPILKRPEDKGDLFITFQVDFPSEEWLNGLDLKSLEQLLPPKKGDLWPKPTVVDEVEYEKADIADFGANDEDDENWVDEDDDEAGPGDCRPQ
ncbi:hypothetical protein FRB96_005608 [Tulasnella sp. 330]|nr:hypothetical protein FRB96_005608 [Tulasnella sp. 330]